MRLLAKGALALVVFVLVLLVAEGAASVFLVSETLAEDGYGVLAERRHTTYDPLLGWCNEPGVAIPDMYGPGIGITINAQGFRGTRDTLRAVPPGKVRVVASGDSFTLGYGVGDAQTWVAALEELDPRIESVNMGQGGYGTDQAYLWWERDGQPLEQDVHLFAFITGDFSRAHQAQNYGYPKPYLVVERGELVTKNVPVPRWPYLVPYLTQNERFLEELAVVRLGQELSGYEKNYRAMSPEELEASVLAMFDAMAAWHRANGSVLVAVHLPMKKAHRQRELNDWQVLLRRELPRRGVAYFDLLVELQRVDRARVPALFIGKEGLYPGAQGHFSVAGNRWAAATIHRMLGELPEVARRLDAR